MFMWHFYEFKYQGILKRGAERKKHFGKFEYDMDWIAKSFIWYLHDEHETPFFVDLCEGKCF